MGAVFPNIPLNLLAFLADIGGSRVFIETGTYLGDSTAAAAKLFDRVISVEAQPELYERAVQIFAGEPRIELLFGESGEVLKRLMPKIDGPAILWLDAHWSCGITAGEHYECPVLSEIEAVTSSRNDHIILIDDARYFLAPPPEPHNPEAWPSIADIVHALSRDANRSYVVVVDDVIISVPAWLAPDMKTFIRSRLHEEAEANPSL